MSEPSKEPKPESDEGSASGSGSGGTYSIEFGNLAPHLRATSAKGVRMLRPPGLSGSARHSRVT